MQKVLNTKTVAIAGGCTIGTFVALNLTARQHQLVQGAVATAVNLIVVAAALSYL